MSNKRGSNELQGQSAPDIDLNDPKLMAELRAAGWEDSGPDELEENSEMLALEKELEEEEKREQTNSSKYNKQPFNEAAMDNVKLDDDDSDLADELNELGSDESDIDVKQQHENHITELSSTILKMKHAAKGKMNEGNREAAIEIMKKAKQLEAELATSQRILKIHNIAQSKNASQGNEENKENEGNEEFDYDEIVSFSVLEYENEQAKEQNDEFLKDKLGMSINLLQTNIQAGLLSMDAYTEALLSKVKEYTEKAGSAPSKLKKRLLKHIELMETELAETPEEGEEEEEEEEEEEPPPPPARTLSHSQLLENLRYKEAYDLLEDYKEAYSYLKSAGAAERCEPIVVAAEHLSQAISLFLKGENPEVNLLPLLPQHITGMEEKQRKTELLTLIKFSLQQKEEAKQRALDSLKIQDKQAALQFKALMVECEARAKELDLALKNPWQTVPATSAKVISKKVLVVNGDLAPGVLSLSFGKVTGLRDSKKYYVRVVLSGAGGKDTTIRTISVSGVVSKGFNTQETLELDEKTFKSLLRRRLTLEVVTPHTFRSDKVKGTATVKLEDFATKATLELNLTIARSGPITLFASLRIHSALQTPEFATSSEDFHFVAPLLPPFRTPGTMKPARRAAPEEVKTVVPPSSLSPEEIADPNLLDNLNSVGVLEGEIERLKKLIIQARDNGKSATPLMNRQRDVMRKKGIIEAQIENETISAEQYKDVLLTQIEHDMLLAKHFKDTGARQKLELVIGKVRIMKQEVKEIQEDDNND